LNLHEYQSKFRFAEFGIPVPHGQVATTPEEARMIAQKLGGAVAIKAQVLVGGRGKANGIKIARNPEEAEQKARQILGMEIKGHTVHKVLVDPASNIAQEIYLGITNDRAAGKPVLMTSSEGGIEIEQLAHEKPDAIIREHINPVLGLHNYQTVKIAAAIDLPREHWRPFARIVHGLYKCYVVSDATLTEINPLVITAEGDLLALDGKMIIDDNALNRQPELAAMRDTSAEPEAEIRAREAGISYVKLNGQIGCMVNGAGLAMTTMDMTKLYGERYGIGPANFLDIGGGAKADQVSTALRIILSDPSVKAVLINIFGGLTRGDEVARGVIEAYDEVKPQVPIVIRLQGTNAEEGLKLVHEMRIPNLIAANTLTDAAKKAVEAARGAK
jgi:succinyl-CoA synthetase beta subunit